MKIIDQGIVAKGEKGTDRQSCAFSSICVLPSGRWLCSFRAAPAKSSTTENTLINWSDDRGKTWSDPVAPWDNIMIGKKTGSIRTAYLTAIGGNRVLAALCWVDHTSPSLPFFNEETEGLLDTRIFLAESDDHGKTWSKPILVDTSPFTCPTPITGPILQLPNGDLACQYELNKHYCDPEVWRHSSVIMFSSDGGKTWPEHSIASNDPENRLFYWDQRPNLLADGTLLNLFWTYDNKAGVYLNIHARASHDNGRSWLDMRDTGVPGQAAQPVSLPHNRIAMVYVERTDSPAIKARISNDAGRIWPQDIELIIYDHKGTQQTESKSSMQDAWTEMAKFSVRLPDTASVSDTGSLVVFYSGDNPDHTSIRWALIGE